MNHVIYASFDARAKQVDARASARVGPGLATPLIMHSPFLTIACFVSYEALTFEALTLFFSVQLGNVVFRFASNPFHVLIIHILKIHYLESSNVFGKCLSM